jgi:hypothetical protein
MPHINDFGSAELLELMHFRDQAFASAAEEAERKIRFTLNKERLLKLEVEFLKQTDLLLENMTRAYNAEKKVVDLELKINRLINNHLRDIEHLRSSFTWRIGYFFLTPLRLLRTLKRS